VRGEARARLAVIGLVVGLWLISAARPARADPWPGLEGVWSWGSPRRSADVPFLRITRSGGQWSVETKHYMHAYFVAEARDVRIDGKHLEFTYWYEPLHRWARCSFDAAADTMAGVCDGEIDAQTWGAVPSYLWRATVAPPSDASE
jgi:hypothetical protein